MPKDIKPCELLSIEGFLATMESGEVDKEKEQDKKKQASTVRNTRIKLCLAATAISTVMAVVVTFVILSARQGSNTRSRTKEAGKIVYVQGKKDQGTENFRIEAELVEKCSEENVRQWNG